MTNQAAQTMPDNPELVNQSLDDAWKNIITNYGLNPIHRDVAAVTHALAKFALSQTAGVADGWKLVPVEPTDAMIDAYIRMFTSAERFSAEKMWSSLLAAAPAASGGEDRLTRAEAIAEFRSRTGASVSERARAILSQTYRDAGFDKAAEWVLQVDLDNELYVLDRAVIRALEQALTQQRGPASYDAGMAMHWIERYAAGIDEECQLDRIAEAFTTPQPSADAVRELAATWRKRAERKRFVGLKNEALLDEAHADELESLLSAASGDKGVG